ncbi:hypothetical protein [Ponticaulis koreensis]|uniref:hypothetical protein n=1 Tax=Ponticaulis koreensis TaxID=1123045 RepID=UPI0004077CA6|nr:hypothetical protein [Ponticaulis koreensis]
MGNKTGVKSVVAASVLLVTGTIAAPASGQGADEMSPSVSDVRYQLAQMQGRHATLVDTEIEDLVDDYSAGMGSGDHIQGITITGSGRIVLSISRTETDPSTSCDGLITFSSPFDSADPDAELDWFFYCPSQADSPEGHPSNIQATGEVIIVGTDNGSRFYHIGEDNVVEYLDHLDMEFFFDNDNDGVLEGGRDASGVVYNQNDNRFYAINAAGTVVPDVVMAELCRTDANVSLLDDTTSFGECTEFQASISGQGSNLIMQDDGTMFLVSAFSSDEFWPDDSDDSQTSKAIAYGIACLEQGASVPLEGGWDMEVEYEDILHVSEIDYSTFNQSSANLISDVNLGRTQYLQACVHHRPAFRFSGGVSVLNDGMLLGLWSGRQNPPVNTQTDSFEFAFQSLEAAGSQSLAFSVAIDCSTENISNDGTEATITATFFDHAWRQVGEASRDDLSNSTCVFGNPEIEAVTDAEAEYVRLSTDGSDAFMIDRLIMYREGDEVRTSGANNDRGWCLSTDPGDGTGSWEYAANGVCTSEHTWSYSRHPVDNPRDGILARRGDTRTHRYALDIDCDVDDIENEGTASKLTAIYLDADRNEIGRSSFQEDTNAPILPICRDMEWETVVQGEARYLQIHTDGGDGAMLDQIFVELDGEEIKVLGASNDSGWCLSTQESDAHGSWQGYAYQNTCQTSWEFDLR